MRIGLGLLSLLIAVGVGLWLYARHAGTVVQQGRAAQEQVEPMTGRGPDGRSIDGSAEYKSHKGGLLVTAVTPGGWMDRYMGLRVGDLILRAGEVSLRDFASDEGLATTTVLDMAQRQRPFVVVRGGQELTLTPGANPGVAAPPRQPGVKIPLH